ncbi:hypothetical protein ACGFJC_28060 [Nonomuraea fuscirosea]|uniref:hypothetical protein n=1 Tax=Nonomuraea fuscirosea TaxID=1291556 RepID=UPI003440616D
MLEFAGDVQEIAETKEHRLLWRLTGTLITGRVAPCVVIDDKSWWKTKVGNGTRQPCSPVRLSRRHLRGGDR